MQLGEIFKPYTIAQNQFQKADLIESPSNSTASPQSPVNENADFHGGLVLVPIFLIVLAWVLNCRERFNLQKNFSNRLNTLKHYHKIPCSNCHFFNQDIYLKCAVHPSSVLTAKAINCPDYCFKYSNNAAKSHNFKI